MCLFFCEFSIRSPKQWDISTANNEAYLYCTLKFFFSCTPKNLYCTPKKYHMYCKKSICSAKIAMSTFSHTLGILLSFWHTFKYFGILSQLLAHCAADSSKFRFRSKSRGRLCCCHETGLKPVLLG
jgi:hypothetical protein